jgi:hypothetical protein
MVALLGSGTASEEIEKLKHGVAAEFGETMWMTETSFYGS